MRRRAFLTRFPLALTGGAASVLASARPDTAERMELLALLERAGNLYEDARNLIHWPPRYDQARPLLVDALETAAQVWLRERGIRRLERNNTWSFTACNVRDEVSGVAWNHARDACLKLSDYCDHMGRWSRSKEVTYPMFCGFVGHARRDLSVALDAASQCIECTRHAFVGRIDPLPPRPQKPRHWG